MVLVTQMIRLEPIQECRHAPYFACDSKKKNISSLVRVGIYGVVNFVITTDGHAYFLIRFSRSYGRCKLRDHCVYIFSNQVENV